MSVSLFFNSFQNLTTPGHSSFIIISTATLLFKMDLTRIQLIQESNLNDLKNINYLENMIIKLGFNTEILY